MSEELANKEEVYKEDDLILNCPIKIRITPEYVFLYIGGRDHQWARADGRHVGSGVALCDPVPRVEEKEASRIIIPQIAFPSDV